MNKETQCLQEILSSDSFISEYVSPDQLLTQENKLIKQEKLHEIIRNDEDYDDWDYGTEPSYGKSWKPS